MSPDSLRPLHIPAWAGRLYIALSCILLPWTIYLGFTLPRHHLSNHWDISWTGLDVALIVTLLLTGILAWRRSEAVVMTAASAGSLLLVDAWFDVMSERQAAAFYQALVLAIFIEVPLALMSFAIAQRALQRTK